MHAGRADLKGLFRLGTKRDHIKFRMWQLNSLIRYNRVLSKASGKYCGQSTLVIDLEGFEFSNLYMPTFKLFNEANKLAQMACAHVCICASVHLCICASVHLCVWSDTPPSIRHIGQPPQPRATPTPHRTPF